MKDLIKAFLKEREADVYKNTPEYILAETDDKLTVRVSYGGTQLPPQHMRRMTFHFLPETLEVSLSRLRFRFDYHEWSQERILEALHQFYRWGQYRWYIQPYAIKVDKQWVLYAEYKSWKTGRKMQPYSGEYNWHFGENTPSNRRAERGAKKKQRRIKTDDHV
jgi:branched-subunit amino acid aminotransferase/4-amino-4-deoxychorismate lyase